MGSSFLLHLSPDELSVFLYACLPSWDMPCLKKSKNCVQFSQLILSPWKYLGKMT